MERKKIPGDALERVSRTPLVSEDQDILGLYIFGSGAQNRLQPLSDLDFGILLSRRLDKKQRFGKQINFAVQYFLSELQFVKFTSCQHPPLREIEPHMIN